MKPAITHASSCEEFFIEENCHILEVGNTPADADVSVARARVEPGATTRWHRLKGTTERYYILSGSGRVEVGDLPAQDVGPGDFVLIPPQVRQRITNHGDEDLLFIAICSPRFTPDAYEDVDDTTA